MLLKDGGQVGGVDAWDAALATQLVLEALRVVLGIALRDVQADVLAA